MKKKLLMMTAVAAMSMTMSMTAFAGVTEGGTKGSWQKDATGWWWQNEDGSWANTGWYWIDGNDDGVAECYFFDGNGYMMANSVSGDGFYVNADGAWVVDGVVQTRNLNEAKTPEQSQVAAGELNKDNGGYNEWGASNAAIEMKKNSREENAKFGEVKVDDVSLGTCTIIHYANGLKVFYPYEGSGASKKIMVSELYPELDGTYLFKYYDKDLDAKAAAEKLWGLGFNDRIVGDAYAFASPSHCNIAAGEAGLSWGKVKGYDAIISLR